MCFPLFVISLFNESLSLVTILLQSCSTTFCLTVHPTPDVNYSPVTSERLLHCNPTLGLLLFLDRYLSRPAPLKICAPRLLHFLLEVYNYLHPSQLHKPQITSTYFSLYYSNLSSILSQVRSGTSSTIL